MRYIVFVLFVAIASNSLAQSDVMFRVVSFSEGVTIDGEVPTVGANVTKDQKRIEVPTNGYLGGITSDGEVFKITGSTGVNRVKANNKMRKVVPFTYAYPNHIIVSSVSRGNREVVGDTLFFNWKVDDQDAEELVTIKFSDLFYNELVSVRVGNNNGLFVIGPLFSQTPNVIFELTCLVNIKGRSPKEAHSGLLGLERPKEERLARIKFDLQRLPQTSDRLFYESALYLLNDYTYDSSLCLYKILKSKQATADPILAKYYQVMFDKSDLKSVKD
jgi:hypothetical protein